MATIILGITGSIAAFKAASLASALTKDSHKVLCVMTPAATRFITPLTLQSLTHHPVLVSDEHGIETSQPDHIALADHCDLLLVAPITANTLAHFAQGIASTPLDAIYLATKAPVLLAPAMNGHMWQHPAVKRNVTQLTKDGCHWVAPQKDGVLACGYRGEGRLATQKDILQATYNLL